MKGDFNLDKNQGRRDSTQTGKMRNWGGGAGKRSRTSKSPEVEKTQDMEERAERQWQQQASRETQAMCSERQNSDQHLDLPQGITWRGLLVGFVTGDPVGCRSWLTQAQDGRLPASLPRLYDFMTAA